MKRLLATRRLENVPDSRQHRWLHLVCRNLQRVAAQGDRAVCVFTCQCVHSVHIYGAFLCGVVNGAVVSCSCVYNKNGFFNCFFFCLNKNIKHDLNTSSTKSSIENWVQLLYTMSKPFFFPLLWVRYIETSLISMWHVCSSCQQFASVHHLLSCW